MSVPTVPSTIHGGPITSDRGKTKCREAAASSASATGQRGSGGRVRAGDGEGEGEREPIIAHKLNAQSAPRSTGRHR